MKAKKLLSALLCIALCLGCLLMLAACGDDAGCTHESIGADGKCTECGEQITAPSPSVGDGELALIAGNKATFKVVVGSSANNAISDIDKFISKVNGVLAKDGAAERVADKQDTASDIEIIIGSVNTRGDKFKVDEHYLGHKGYEVKLVDSKIVVYAGDPSQYKKALEWLEDDVFGIKKSIDSIDSLVVNSEKVDKQVLTEYKVESVTIGGNDLDRYVIAYDKSYSDFKTFEDLAKDVQTLFYTNIGAWCEVVSLATVKDDDLAIILDIEENDGESDGYSAVVTESGDFVFKSMFPDRFYDLAYEVLIETIASTSKKNLKIATGVYDEKNLRDIYYSEFGATNNGKNDDDFAAIKACHDYANKWGHVVHADEGATYYIGNSTKGESAIIQTDTYWHGAYFYFDDSTYEVHADDGCDDCATREAPIFMVTPTRGSVDVKKVLQNHIDEYGILKNFWDNDGYTQKIEGWNLEYDSLVRLYDNTRKIWIRDGIGSTHQNADSGDNPNEIILVHKDGTIDESTPLSFDYVSVSWAHAYYIEDEPIVIDGGGATINNIANRPTTNEYIASARNVEITRSNVTFKNFDHIVTEEGTYRGPYSGILYASLCNNTRFENVRLQQHKSKYHEGVGQGTYEIGGTAANNISYYNVRVTNFFCDGAADNTDKDGNPYKQGAVEYRGVMGTNYCRNFYFEGCSLNSFDAHKGLGNLTIVDCEFEHINIMGAGNVLLKDSTVYLDGSYAVICCRPDYGASWRGNVTIDNVNARYSNTVNKYDSNTLMMLKTSYEEKDYDSVYDPETDTYVAGKGSVNYLPTTFTIKNFSLTKYEMTEYIAKNADGCNDIVEKELAGTDYINLFDNKLHNSYTRDDISKYKDDGGYSNKNIYIGTENLIIENCTANIVIPATPQFQNMKVTVDGTPLEYPFKKQS